MLNRVRVDEPPEVKRAPEAGTSAGQFDVDGVIAIAQRQKKIVAAAVVLGLATGALYLITAVPQYTATSSILVFGQKDQTDFSEALAALTLDSSAVDSQVEVLKSQKIALAVIANLKLTKNKEFSDPQASFLGNAVSALRSLATLRGWFNARTLSDQEVEAERTRVAVERLNDGMAVRRVNRTYVLDVDFTSPNPSLAATIANGIADAYLAEQVEAKFESARKASGWMQERIKELKANSVESDLAIQKFKADKGLITADGKLVSDQKLTELNAELSVAHGETAKADARYAQITEMLKSGGAIGDVTDSLGNVVINDLREKLLRTVKSESELERKLGKSHLQVIRLNQEVAEYKKLILEEVRHIAETYRSERDVARAKEESLNKSMAALVDKSAGTNQTLVQLRELDRESESYRNLYQSFLQRYQAILQQQSFPISEARVITPATPPTEVSYPRKSVVLSFSALLGLFCGAGVAAFKEFRDRTFRTAAQVREELGLEFLGMLPVIERVLRSDKEPQGEAKTLVNTIRPEDNLQEYSLDHPLSNFTETLRSMKVAVDLALSDRDRKIVGIISMFPNEGKSTVSKNFASLIAHLGAHTLLIDGDLRNPGLTRAIARRATSGSLEAIKGEKTLEELCHTEPRSGLRFLPTPVGKRINHTSDLLSSPGMRNLLLEAGKEFDYVIVDLPPLGPVVDVKAAASLFDAFVLVVEWGRTSRRAVQTMIESDERLAANCVGVVFNKVKLAEINSYEGYGSKDYHYNSYVKYYNREGDAA